jgi:hypothetical protein
MQVWVFCANGDARAWPTPPRILALLRLSAHQDLVDELRNVAERKVADLLECDCLGASVDVHQARPVFRLVSRRLCATRSRAPRELDGWRLDLRSMAA